MATSIIPLIDHISLDDTDRATIGLLWIIRDSSPIEYDELPQLIIGKRHDTGRKIHLMQRVDTMLETLHDMGLIEVIGLSKPHPRLRELLENRSKAQSIKLRSTRNLSDLQKFFKIHLSDLTADTRPTKAYPIFGDPLPKNQHEFAQIFVLMPFKDEMLPVYN